MDPTTLTQSLVQQCQALSLSDPPGNGTLIHTVDCMEDTTSQVMIRSGDRLPDPVHYLPSLLSHAIYMPIRSPSASGTITSVPEASSFQSPSSRKTGALRRRQSLPVLGARERGSLLRMAWSIRLPSTNTPSVYRPRRAAPGLLAYPGHCRRRSILCHSSSSLSSSPSSSRVRKATRPSSKHPLASSSRVLIPYARLARPRLTLASSSSSKAGILDENELVEGIRNLCLLSPSSPASPSSFS
ncbi:MAG: hypothetical protein DHS80DRAFT_30054 [Piptocephalis tieghemiana]|nr:MAG: hypothetical protein DHS80DRAFT_30054 [Piptocephalis tieghemiana]